jgi:hypothetical protein
VSSPYQSLINQYATQYGIDPSVASSVFQFESSGQQFNSSGAPLTNPTSGAVGLGQIIPSSVPAGFTYDQVATDPAANIQASMLLLSQKIQAANPGDSPDPTTGWTAAQTYNGLVSYEGYGGPQSQANAQTIMNNAGYSSADLQTSSINSGNLGANPTDPLANSGGLANTAVAAQPVVGQPITNTASLYPSYVITEGLDETPWYKDGLITENPWLKQVPAPVTFEVMLPSGKYLSASTGAALSIQLNASLSNFEVQSGHVVNKRPSRTALHVTMWGQEADLISGEGNTGAFMNAFGLTSYLSVSQISSDLAAQISRAFTPQKTGIDGSSGDYNSSSMTDLRIAARDAFMEMLALFKANGIVWFRNSQYSSAQNVTGQTQVGVDAFSPQTGLSNYQMSSRPNDVMHRGQVVMKFRNSAYLGYFKSLDYQLDADHPYYWKFRFVFKVERTLTINYFSSTQTLTATSVASSASSALAPSSSSDSLPNGSGTFGGIVGINS